MNFLLNTVCGILKFLNGPESQFGVYQASKNALPGSGFLINILISGVMIISLVLLVRFCLFWIITISGILVYFFLHCK